MRAELSFCPRLKPRILREIRWRRCDAGTLSPAISFSLRGQSEFATMAWIDDESWWEPEPPRRDAGRIGFSAGRTLYWLASILAAVIVIFVAADVFISWAQGAPTVRIVALIAAIVVWLIGRLCRAILP
jgi:hypothetical protein